MVLLQWDDDVEIVRLISWQMNAKEPSQKVNKKVCRVTLVPITHLFGQNNKK